jgi:hypothetical protein
MKAGASGADIAPEVAELNACLPSRYRSANSSILTRRLLEALSLQTGDTREMPKIAINVKNGRVVPHCANSNQAVYARTHSNRGATGLSVKAHCIVENNSS